MRLEFAMLADAVVATADHKLIIEGADVDNVRAAAYPAVHPALALVAMFVQEPSDRAGDEHEVRVETTTPLNQPWLAPTAEMIKLAASSQDHPAKISIVLRLAMLVLPMQGRYVFRLLVDGSPLRDIPLYALEVAHTPAGSTTPTAVS